MALENKTSTDWLVVYTKPKNEQKVAKELGRLGIDNYCPMLTLLKQYSDREEESETALNSLICFRKNKERKEIVKKYFKFRVLFVLFFGWVNQQ